MGHSQSYDLRNPEPEDKNRDPVRGVRRVSKEHQTDSTGADTEHFDQREDELRERIRKEQLKKREEELETLRIRQHESREPIIDAYRSTPQLSPQTGQPAVYTEFNYYDSLKHPHPVDPTTYFVLRPRKDINEGRQLPFEPTVPTGSTVIPSPTPRYVPPMSGTFSKRTVVTTYSYTSNGAPQRGAVPAPAQYDTVPDERAPRYDEVPVMTRVIPVERETTVTHRNPTPITRLEDEVPQMPLGQKRDYAPYPRQSSTPSPILRETVHTVPVTYSNPSPSPQSYRSLEVVPLEKEVPQVPLAKSVVYRDPVPYRSYSNPKEVTVTPDYRIPKSTTVTRTPSPVLLEKTLLAREESQIPLKHMVAPRDYVPYSANSTPATVTHVRRSSETASTVPERTVTPVYRNLPPRPLETTELYPEVPSTPLGHHVTYTVPSEHIVSELRAEKRMIVGIDAAEPQSHVTYVTVVSNPEFPTYATSPTPSVVSLEPLHRHPEVANRPVATRPSQSSYPAAVPVVVEKTRVVLNSTSPPPRQHHDQHTQYSRRPSEDVVVYSRILEQQKPTKKTCDVENCTHVEVRDSPIVARRRISEDLREKENRLKIYIDEKEMDDVIDLAKDEDVGPMTTTSRRCFEDKLHYNSYFPTMSLGRRPVVSFYDKLH